EASDDSKRPSTVPSTQPGNVGRDHLTRNSRILPRKDVFEEAVKSSRKEEEPAPKSANNSLSRARHLCGAATQAPSSSVVSVPSDPGSEAGMEEEWQEIGRRTEELAKQARENKGKVVTPDVLGQPVSFKEVHGWLQKEFGAGSADKGASATRCDEHGLMDKEFLLRVKGTKFDFNDSVHHRMLRTMYCKLARCRVCPRVGSHWEVLGFQGSDPLTDLNRSGGLLNVVHMFFSFSHYFDTFKGAFHLAQDDQQNFPLAAVCINITKMVVDSLLEQKRNLDDGSGVFDAACRIFSGGLNHFYWQWRSQKRTIRDTELTFNEIKTLLKSEELEKAPAQQTELLQVAVASMCANVPHVCRWVGVPDFPASKV
ncbi:unnamed protein product, partial [Effrenium voratum]